MNTRSKFLWLVHLYQLWQEIKIKQTGYLQNIKMPKRKACYILIWLKEIKYLWRIKRCMELMEHFGWRMLNDIKTTLNSGTNQWDVLRFSDTIGYLSTSKCVMSVLYDSFPIKQLSNETYYRNSLEIFSLNAANYMEDYNPK